MLPLDKAIVHRLPNYKQKLEQGVVVLEKAPAEVPALVTAFAQQLVAAKKGPIAIKAGTPLNILTAGPMLDSPDTATPVRLLRRGGRLTLDIHRTSVSSEGWELRRNIPWTPLVQVPVDLPAGKYQLDVNWHVVPSVPAQLGTRNFKPQPPLVQTFQFAVEGVVPLNEKKEAKKPAKEAGGQAVNGLKLTLTADKTETVMKADGSDAEPVKLKATFTNVSDKPIKLDAWQIGTRNLQFKVIAPEAQSIPTQTVAGRVGQKPPVKASDFILLKKGESWSVPEQSFPEEYMPVGIIFTGTKYTLDKPGEYRLQYIYAHPKEMDDPLAAGSWVGTVSSNELVLKVKKAKEAGGQAVNGLKLTLTADKTETNMKADGSDAEPVKLKATFTNVSNKPINLYAYDLVWDGDDRFAIKITGPNNDAFQVRDLRPVVRRAPPTPTAAHFPELGTYQINFDSSGKPTFLSINIRQAGAYRFQVIYKNLQNIPPNIILQKSLLFPLSQSCWVGTVSSNELVLTVKGRETGVAEQPPKTMTRQQMSALAKEAAQKIGKLHEMEGIRSRNQHLGKDWGLEQPFQQHYFDCAHFFTRPGVPAAVPIRRFLVVTGAGQVRVFGSEDSASPVKPSDFADILAKENLSAWTDAQYLQAAVLYVHLTAAPHQDGWKLLKAPMDFMAIKFNMDPAREKQRAAMAQLIKTPDIKRTDGKIQVRLWAWHLIGGALREWTLEFAPQGFQAVHKEHGRFGGGGYD